MKHDAGFRAGWKMNNRTGIQAIGQVAIAVADIGRSLQFYVEILGLKLLFKAPPGLALSSISSLGP